VIQTSFSFIENITPSTLVNPVFARHETFHPRFGWLKKGFDAAIENPEIFLDDEATVRLGVGKNMVRSIRYWCNAFKVLDNDNPSKFGERLLDNKGWDSFCEDPASLWLLHWNLLKPPCNAAAWYFVFHLFQGNDFTQNDLFLALCDYRDSLGGKIADSSLEKDITCILRMYVEQSSKDKPSEDTLDCPFTELGILHTAADTKHFTFRIGEKNNLPPEIVVAACLEYAVRVGDQKTIAMPRLLYDPGSPGMAFKLIEGDVCDAIERVSRHFNSLFLSDTAGIIQFSFTADPWQLATDILEHYYHNRGNRTSK